MRKQPAEIDAHIPLHKRVLRSPATPPPLPDSPPVNADSPLRPTICPSSLPLASPAWFQLTTSIGPGSATTPPPNSKPVGQHDTLRLQIVFQYVEIHRRHDSFWIPLACPNPLFTVDSEREVDDRGPGRFYISTRWAVVCFHEENPYMIAGQGLGGRKYSSLTIIYISITARETGCTPGCSLLDGRVESKRA